MYVYVSRDLFANTPAPARDTLLLSSSHSLVKSTDDRPTQSTNCTMTYDWLIDESRVVVEMGIAPLDGQYNIQEEDSDVVVLLV